MRFAWSSAADGDLSGALDERAVPLPDMGGAPAPWTWLHQVHGTDVVVVRAPGEHAGRTADAAITTEPGCTLAVRTADCAPVVIEGRGSVAVVHLGWRGLVGGLVERVVAAMDRLGDEPVAAHLGPCIRPDCYEFAGPERRLLTDRFGPSVAATTSSGRPALDLPAAVALALREQGVASLHDAGACTACEPGWFSHRARADTARLATVAWIEAG